MKQRKMYNVSCSGLVAMIFALFGIGVSTYNEVATKVSENQDKTQTMAVISEIKESYNDINTTTKECLTESITTETTETTFTTGTFTENIETTYEVQTEEFVTEDLVIEESEIEETSVTTTETSTQEEKTEENVEVETQDEGLFDCLVIDWQEIPIVRLPATQSNVDRNDVVLDTSVWTTERDLYFFGHNMQSFAFLHWVNVGDVIKFYDGYEEKLYVVERSERGEMTEDETYIISNKDGTELVYTDFGYETIRLITCSGSAKSTKRWVVIARKI